MPAISHAIMWTMQTNPDTLYYSPGAASMAVHWLLIELDRPHRLALVDTQSGQQKSPEYLALNPNGVVPTLVIDGQPRFEVSALLMTLADADPAHRLAPEPASPQRAEYVQWMFHLANAVQPLLRIWWYPQEPAGEDHREAVLAHTRPRIEAAWQRLDAQLARRGPYLLGDAPSAADIYLTMLLRWSRGMPKPGDAWPQLAELARLMKARRAFAELYAREGLEEWR